MRSSNYFYLEKIKLLNCSQIPLIIQFSRSLIFILANDWGLQPFQYRNSSASNCQQRRTKTGNPVADQILVLKETPITVVLPQLTCLEWITSLPISDISRCGIISSSGISLQFASLKDVHGRWDNLMVCLSSVDKLSMLWMKWSK